MVFLSSYLRHRPYSLRPSMLRKITTRFARDAIFWPNMSKNIGAYSQSCPTCFQCGKQAPILCLHDLGSSSRETYSSSNISNLVTVDRYSDFYELDQLINTESTTIIVLTKAHFARHGIPVGFLTDNGQKAKEV